MALYMEAEKNGLKTVSFPFSSIGVKKKRKKKEVHRYGLLTIVYVFVEVNEGCFPHDKNESYTICSFRNILHRMENCGV